MKRLHVRLAMLFFSLLLLALVCSGTAFAAEPSVEGSMVITGLIAVNPSGTVYGYSLDHRDKISPKIVTLIGDTVSGWHFAPVEVGGKPVLAKARMSLRIVARKAGSGHYVASVLGAAFGDVAEQATSTRGCVDGSCLSLRTREVPVYPVDLVRQGVSGTVYLAMEIDRQGRVAKAAVQQVDLRIQGDNTALQRWRDALGQSALSAARKWTFNIPTTGPAATQVDWIVYQPVDYSFTSGPVTKPSYGHWDDYVPGPVRTPPWVESSGSQMASDGSADAIPNNGELFVPDARFVLLNRLGGDADSLQPASGSGHG